MTSLLNGFVLFVVPTRLQGELPYRLYAHPTGAVVSGLVQSAICAGVWVLGFLELGLELSTAAATQAVAEQVGSSHAMGGFMYLTTLASHAIRPGSIFLTLTFFDGGARILDCLVNETYRGLWCVDLVDYVVGRLRREGTHRTLLQKLGPERPDQIELRDEDGQRWLDLYASREKDFSDRQVVGHGTELYLLDTAELVPRGPHQAMRYRFRMLPPNEVPRGQVIRLD